MTSLDKNISEFPSTRFYGSKKRILKWIHNNLKDLEFNTVLDGFGGTASVSLLFKSMGKKVTYNDALKFNTITATALLADKNPFSSIKEINQILNEIEPHQGFIYNNFEGIFYTDEENKWLDGAINKINSFKGTKRAILLYCLFQACLKKRPYNLFHRANLYFRLNSNGDSKFGNKTTWDSPFQKLILEAYKEVEKIIWEGRKSAIVLNPNNILELDYNNYDLVYLDPPYINGSYSEDYLKKYHFLEGLTLYNEWEKYLDENIKCKPFKAREDIRQWSRKSEFKDSLFNLIDGYKESIVVLSYVANSYPSIQDIIEYMDKRFSKVDYFDTSTSQALSTKKRNEVLIIAQ